MRQSRLGAVSYELGEVETTQAVVRELADARAPEGTLVVAEHQRAGRGRAGRVWLDQPGASLLFSLLLRPAIQAAEVPQLALVGAVGVAEAVEEVTGLVPGIKWPNDLLLDGCKFAGLLAEAASDGDVVTRVILGVGINVNQNQFPVALAARATSLALALGRPVDRRTLLDAALRRLDTWYNVYLEHGFAPVRAEWCRRAVTLGRAVVVGQVRGTAVGLDHDGALLVRSVSGDIQRVVAGEVLDAPGH